MNKKIFILLYLLVGSILVVPEIALAEGMSFRALSMQETVTVEGQNITTNDHRMEVKPGAYVRVELTAAGGTGYEWQLRNEELQTLEVSYKTSDPLEPGKAGGPVKTVFIMKVKENARGEERLYFSLVRPWEKQGKEAKEFELTVWLR